MATKASIQKLIDEKSDSITLQDPKGTFIVLQYVFALHLHNDHVNGVTGTGKMRGCSMVGVRQD